MIRDVRIMLLDDPSASVHDVETFYRRVTASVRFRGFPERAGAREWQESSEVLTAYISDGRWVADCPLCNGGIALWPEGPSAGCVDCGTMYANIDYPTPRQIRDAERVLAARPRGQADWWRHRGETIDDLKVQNLMHGYRTEA